MELFFRNNYENMVIGTYDSILRYVADFLIPLTMKELFSSYYISLYFFM